MLKSISEVRATNVQSIIDNHGLSRTDFAEKSGITYSQLGQYFGQNPSKVIGDNVARRIEKAFELEKFWLDQNWQNPVCTSIDGNNNNINNGTNHGVIGGENIHQTVAPRNIANSLKESFSTKPLPLFDIDDGVAYALSDDNDVQIIERAKESSTFIPSDSHAFGIKMVYQLTGITQTPISAGDILIVEPCIPPRNGDLVLLCLGYPNNKRGIIVRLFVDMQNVMSVQRNSNPPEILPAGSVICGVVRKVERDYLESGIITSRLDKTYKVIATLVE